MAVLSRCRLRRRLRAGHGPRKRQPLQPSADPRLPRRPRRADRRRARGVPAPLEVRAGARDRRSSVLPPVLPLARAARDRRAAGAWRPAAARRGLSGARRDVAAGPRAGAARGRAARLAPDPSRGGAPSGGQPEDRPLLRGPGARLSAGRGRLPAEADAPVAPSRADRGRRALRLSGLRWDRQRDGGTAGCGAAVGGVSGDGSDRRLRPAGAGGVGGRGEPAGRRTGGCQGRRGARPDCTAGCSDGRSVSGRAAGVAACGPGGRSVGVGRQRVRRRRRTGAGCSPRIWASRRSCSWVCWSTRRRPPSFPSLPRPGRGRRRRRPLQVP